MRARVGRKRMYEWEVRVGREGDEIGEIEEVRMGSESVGERGSESGEIDSVRKGKDTF